MLKGVIPFVIVAIIILAIYLNTSIHQRTMIPLDAQKGHVSIPKNSEDEVFLLGGEFVFFANKFNAQKDEKEYAIFPGSLKDTSIASNFGYGSYSLHIKGLNPALTYSLIVPHAFSSCSIVANGMQIGKQGNIARRQEDEEPSVSSIQAIFRPDSNGEARLVFNLSNFTFRKGGIFSKIVLGEVGKVYKIFRNDLIFNGIVFAAIFTIASFLFLLFFFYKQARFVLWFALAFIFVAIRATFFYPHLAPQIFPNLHWHTVFIIRHIPLPVILFTVSLKKALKLCYKIPYATLLVLASLYTIAVFSFSANTIEKIAVYYQFVTIAFLLYNLVILLTALIKKLEFAKWMFFSAIILIVVGAYDLFIYANQMPGLYFAPVGSLFSIILIAIMVLQIYSTSMQKVDVLREESKTINNSLVRFVPEGMIKLLNKKSIKELEVGEYVEMRMPILSMDIRSFTKRSENLSPQAVFDFLNKYFATIVPIIRTHNGIILKYLGDGFFALFPDGVDSAVECAVEMQKELDESGIFQSDKKTTNIGIGIDLNDVLLGTVGNAKRMDSIIISNAYKNTDSMQGVSKKYGSSIVISSSVFSALRPSEKLFARPIQLVKTKSNTSQVLYEIYTNDDEELKLLKSRSQVYVMEAFKAISSGNLKDAYMALKHSLSIFPNDPVASQYLSLFKR